MSEYIEEQKIYGDPRLKLKYQILNKLGEGCFGTIYKAINRTYKREIALKLEVHPENNSKKSSLANQINIMEKLKGIEGVPAFYGAGRWTHGYYMEIQLLSSSLYDQKHKQYSQAQIYVMLNQLIQILKQIHEKGVIHQDLKPQNIMRKAHGTLCIIDFGLSSIYNPQNTEAANKKRGFIGTPRYASLAAHYETFQSPKDDLQSLLYVVGSLYNKKVPWFQLRCPASKRLQKIQKYKEISAADWFKQCGTSFVTAYEYLRELQPKDAVDYDYITNLFQSARKSCVIKTQKFKSPNHYVNNRRRSDADVFLKIPSINIHYVDPNNKNSKRMRKLSYKEDGSQVSRSQNNFSQIAHDGYMQLLMLLTQKIFGLNDENKENEDCALVNSPREPQINNIAKYEGIHFKNPFET